MEGSASEQIQDQQFDFGYSDSETESDPGPDDFHRYYDFTLLTEEKDFCFITFFFLYFAVPLSMLT